MLKFKGKAKDFREFMTNLKLIYGRKTTLKEIITMTGALRNVNLY